MCLCNYSRLNWPLANSSRAGSWARSVIPFSFFPGVIVASYNSPEILHVTVTWFAIVPHLIISLQRAAIKPIKFVISFPIQPNPPIAGAGTVPQQVVNKLVFILCFNHDEVCSQSLTKYVWIVPCWGRGFIINIITRFSMYHEACWTSICSEVTQYCKLVLD